MNLPSVGLFVVTLLTAAIPIAMPVLYAALGEAVAERAGVLNIGIEGMMLIGSWAAVMGAVFANNLLVGVLIGMLAGGVFGILLAFFYVTRGTDQVVTGILANIFALGLTSFIYYRLFTEAQPTLPPLPVVRIPLLAAIPGVGRVLFQHNLLVYTGFLLVLVIHLLITRTWFGLNVRAVGEHPRAADTAGVNVHAVRYAATTIAGVMAALGGTTLALADLNGFSENATAGRGFIALAVVALGKWNALGVLLGSFVFGIADALQLRLQAMGLGVPHGFLLMLPYILTILVLVGFVGGARYPAATGVPYRKS